LIVTLTVVARAVGLILYRFRADRSEARQAEQNAGSDTMAKSVVLAVADSSHQGVGLDAAIQTPVDTDFSANREAAASRQRDRPPQLSNPEEPKRVVSETSDREQFRIQYLGGATGEGPEVLSEVEICASNVFAAFRAAGHGAWPPGATGFRLLDSGGQEVFWRRRPKKDLDEPPRSEPESLKP